MTEGSFHALSSADFVVIDTRGMVGELLINPSTC